MLIVGLTGSIGMGKSTAAARFRERGIAVFDADAEVHRLYERDLVPDIAKAFPQTVTNGNIDRQKLSAVLLDDPRRFKDLERIVHPRVREREHQFLNGEFDRGAALAVLEIPLLFEVGSDRDVDITVVVSAPLDVRRERVLSRTGMTQEKLDALIDRQTPEPIKLGRADYTVDTGGSIENCNSQIDAIIAKIRGREGKAYDRAWRIKES